MFTGFEVEKCPNCVIMTHVVMFHISAAFRYLFLCFSDWASPKVGDLRLLTIIE